MMSHNSMSQVMRQCVKECADCHEVCAETVLHCLRMGGNHANPEHIRLLLDCGQICDTSKDFLLRGSDLHAHTCAACAEVCQRCADDCNRMSTESQMKRCADACSRCAESCQSMAGDIA